MSQESEAKGRQAEPGSGAEESELLPEESGAEQSQSQLSSQIVIGITEIMGLFFIFIILLYYAFIMAILSFYICLLS